MCWKFDFRTAVGDFFVFYYLKHKVHAMVITIQNFLLSVTPVYTNQQLLCITRYSRYTIVLDKRYFSITLFRFVDILFSYVFHLLQYNRYKIHAFTKKATNNKKEKNINKRKNRKRFLAAKAIPNLGRAPTL